MAEAARPRTIHLFFPEVEVLRHKFTGTMIEIKIRAVQLGGVPIAFGDHVEIDLPGAAPNMIFVAISSRTCIGGDKQRTDLELQWNIYRYGVDPRRMGEREAGKPLLGDMRELRRAAVVGLRSNGIPDGAFSPAGARSKDGVAGRAGDPVPEVRRRWPGSCQCEICRSMRRAELLDL